MVRCIVNPLMWENDELLILAVQLTGFSVSCNLYVFPLNKMLEIWWDLKRFLPDCKFYNLRGVLIMAYNSVKNDEMSLTFSP